MRALARLFVSGEQIKAGSGSIVLTADDAHYVAHVLRKRPGDQLVLVGPDGTEYLVEIENLDQDSAPIFTRIVEQRRPDRESSTKVSLAQALIKGDKMDFVIQKCTELGAHRFIPFSAKRSVVRLDPARAQNRIQRWQRVAESAARQSGRLLVPEVSSLQSVGQLASAVREHSRQWGPGSVLLAWEGETERSLFEALSRRVGPPTEMPRRDPDHLLLIIGPEGGFDPAEAKLFMDAGAQSVSMGALIFRTETAGMAGLTMILYHTGALGRKKQGAGARG